MIELEPACRQLAALVVGVGDDQLAFPTPCEGMDVAALLNHIDESSVACINAAIKAPAEADSQSAPKASRLADNWRKRIPEQLDTLSKAWRDEAAWTGVTQTGGFTFPAEVAGLVVLNELVLHGWDVARASGQQFECEPQLLDAAYAAMHATAERNPNGIPGVFGAPVEVAKDRPPLDRLIGLSGRDPTWAPSADLV